MCAFKNGMGFLSSCKCVSTLVLVHIGVRYIQYMGQGMTCILFSSSSAQGQELCEEMTESDSLFSIFSIAFHLGTCICTAARVLSEVVRTAHSNFSYVTQSSDKLKNQSLSERLHRTEDFCLEEGSCFIIYC